MLLAKRNSSDEKSMKRGHKRTNSLDLKRDNKETLPPHSVTASTTSSSSRSLEKRKENPMGGRLSVDKTKEKKIKLSSVSIKTDKDTPKWLLEANNDDYRSGEMMQTAIMLREQIQGKEDDYVKDEKMEKKYPTKKMVCHFFIISL